MIFPASLHLVWVSHFHVWLPEGISDIHRPFWSLFGPRHLELVYPNLLQLLLWAFKSSPTITFYQSDHHRRISLWGHECKAASSIQQTSTKDMDMRLKGINRLKTRKVLLLRFAEGVPKIYSRQWMYHLEKHQTSLKNWLVVSTPSEKYSSVGMIIPYIYIY